MARANVKKWALAIAIAIVLNLFINYGIATFYKQPKYEDLCNNTPYNYPSKPMERPVPYDISQQKCQDFYAPDTIQSNCSSQHGYINYRYNSTGCAYDFYCDTCSYKFETEMEKYNSNVFFVLIVIGVISVIGGILIGVESVGSGLLLGGILSIIIGGIRNWSNLTNVIKFILLGAILILLIWIGYKKVKE